MPNNFSTILHKRSSLPSAVPSPQSLSAGEIAINTADGKIFIKGSDDTIKTFLNSEHSPYVLDDSLSAVNTQHGDNTAANVFSVVLGGINNNVDGAGSAVVNGSDNDIAGDYAFIGNGSNNTIEIEGDFGAILGGQNNILSHQESFIIGSNISSHLSGFTYVNNLSATGSVYANGVEITAGGGGSGIDVEVRALTANWEAAYDVATVYQTISSTFLTSETDSQTLTFNEETNELSVSNGNTVSLSALVDAGGSGIDAEVRSLTGNWQSTYLNQSNYLPLSGGTITGSLSVLGTSILNGVTELGNVENSTATIYVDTSKVGINTETPNEELTVVGDVSATGKYYGDGSELIGIVAGDTEATTLVRANSAEWDIAYEVATAYQTASSTFLTSETDSQTLSFDETNKDLTISNGNTVSLSALIDSSIDTGVRDLTANWQSTYLNQSNYLPLSGGTITGSLSVLGTSTLNGVTELGSVLNATATIYVDTSKVGINTETPNKELTVVGDVSATGKYYGDGSSLTGIAAGDTEATTLVRSQSATWSAMLPLTGGDLTGSLTVAGTISASQTISMSGSRVIAGYSQDTTPVYYIRTLTQAEYNAIAVKDDNTIYFIKQ